MKPKYKVTEIDKEIRGCFISGFTDLEVEFIKKDVPCSITVNTKTVFYTYTSLKKFISLSEEVPLYRRVFIDGFPHPERNKIRHELHQTQIDITLNYSKKIQKRTIEKIIFQCLIDSLFLMDNSFDLITKLNIGNYTDVDNEHYFYFSFLTVTPEVLDKIKERKRMKGE